MINSEVLRDRLRRYTEQESRWSQESVKPLPKLTDLHHIDTNTDQVKWVRLLYQLRETDRSIPVMHFCDMHYPYQFDPALEVAYQLAAYVQPRVLVVGSDAGDFGELSSFPQDADELGHRDVLEEFGQFWTKHVNTLRTLCPQATLVFVLGNHEKRVYDYILRLAPAVRTTVWRKFTDWIRQDGDVLWLGETDTVRIGPLLVTHGNRVGLNPAKGLYDDVGGQLSVMAGHNHRLSYYGKRGEDYMVEAITSGCLTHYAPYHKRKRSTQKWQLGTAVAYADLAGRQVDFYNLKFELEPSRVWCRFGRQEFSALITPPKGQITLAQALA